MINELLSIASDLEAWGIKPEEIVDGPPRGLAANSELVPRKGDAYFVLAAFDENREVVFKLFPNGKNLFHHRPASTGNPRGVSYEAVKGKPKDDIQEKQLDWFNRFGKVTKRFAAEVEYDQRMGPIVELADRVAATKPGYFLEGLKAFLQEMSIIGPKVKVVVCADLSLTPQVQTELFLMDVSNAYINRPSEGRDALGRPASGASKKEDLLANTNGVGKVRVYTRSDAIPCLARYGRSTVRVFPMGIITRSLLVKTTEFLLHNDNALTTEKGGVWYVTRSNIELMLDRKKKGDSRETYVDFVVSSLFPRNNIFDAPPKDMDEATWKEAVGTLVEGYKTGTVAPDNFVGNVLVGRKYDKSRIWHLLASMTVSRNDLYDYVMGWTKEVTMPNRRLYAPSLNQLHYYLNRLYKQDGDRISHSPYQVVDIDALYGVFMTKVDPTTKQIVGDRHAIDTVMSVYASRIIPFIYKSSKMKLLNMRAVRTLMPLAYILVHKHFGGEPMNWSFYLGQLLGLSDLLYRDWFRLRGFNSPEQTLADQFITLIDRQPREGLRAFQMRFEKTLKWWSSRKSDEKEDHDPVTNNVGGRLGRYKKVYKAMMAACNDTLPMTMTAAESVSMMSGYFDPFRDPPEEPQAPEAS